MQHIWRNTIECVLILIATVAIRRLPPLVRVFDARGTYKIVEFLTMIGYLFEFMIGSFVYLGS